MFDMTFGVHMPEQYLTVYMNWSSDDAFDGVVIP